VGRSFKEAPVVSQIYGGVAAKMLNVRKSEKAIAAMHQKCHAWRETAGFSNISAALLHAVEDFDVIFTDATGLQLSEP